MKLTNTEWISVPKENLVCDFQAADGYASVRIESNEGHERNLYSSARDLAQWGNLHLNRGLINHSQLVPVEVFTLIEQLRIDTKIRILLMKYFITAFKENDIVRIIRIHI
ncbi:hypothetical protein LQV63_24935 [Paenibacillus profundus]|uniref:Uncharacterized protein n=1 Tax=Paenibacillus profundus TaxID=1173085 RepID=A0ABS8YSB6_9BACL|nr:hypothetical protein [Paenibacillus profundus]MCE5172524.1 hypothetical protein [Paenibacillus profundus]